MNPAQEDSVNVQGLANDLCWCPAQPSVTAAHAHWTVQGGSHLPDINLPGAQDRLADSAFRLFQLDPQDQVFYSLALFTYYARTIIVNCGYVIHPLIEQEDNGAWRAIPFSTDLLYDRTLGSTNHPHGLQYFHNDVFTFFSELRESDDYADEIAFREANGIGFDEFDPMQVWWKVGLVAIKEYGYRLPFLKVRGRTSPLEHLLAWLDAAPARRNL
jgi:hypothetical protein